jgi:hypothetical protein
MTGELRGPARHVLSLAATRLLGARTKSASGAAPVAA